MRMKRPNLFSMLFGFLLGLSFHFFTTYYLETTNHSNNLNYLHNAKRELSSQDKLGVKMEKPTQSLQKKIEQSFHINAAQRATIRSAISRLEERELKNAIEIFDVLCSNEKTCHLQPPFVYLPSQYKIAKKYGLTACSIFKNMSTILMAIMCYLHEPQRILNSKWSFYEQWDTRRACLGYNELDTWPQVAWKLGRKMEDITKFALIREPMEKFMSAYTNQCLTANKCGGCQNLTCIFEMLEQNSEDYRLRGLFGVSGQPRSHVNAHFLPQNWRCEFGTMIDDYVLINYNSSDSAVLIRDLEQLFDDVGVDRESIRFISNKLSSGRTCHSTIGKKELVSEREKLEGDPRLMRRYLNFFFFRLSHPRLSVA
ncbi:unnamed protein product, partial [Mesorhabditis belari]|uniref:Sulfotransferase n=1 Tax=Mesorhabditis belari TaxID=2138241 RepID=A0AAF3ESI1_9BILA